MNNSKAITEAFKQMNTKQEINEKKKAKYDQSDAKVFKKDYKKVLGLTRKLEDALSWLNPEFANDVLGNFFPLSSKDYEKLVDLVEQLGSGDPDFVDPYIEDDEYKNGIVITKEGPVGA